MLGLKPELELPARIIAKRLSFLSLQDDEGEVSGLVMMLQVNNLP